MVKFFKFRKPGPTDLTWEEKNSADYIYHPKDHSKSGDFIGPERKSEKKPQKRK